MNKKRRPKARKSKTKPKKSKFLSLRLQFPPNQTNDDTKRDGVVRARATAAADNSDHLNSFPIDTESQVDEEIREEGQDQENVALFFSAADGGATTLTGLLDNSAAAESNSSHNYNENSRVDYLAPSSASLTYAYGEERAALVRTALRSRDRDSSEDKWICYSEVVERKKVIKEEEVSSSAAVDPRQGGGGAGMIRRVALKLDYEEIMNAWSNKGPLYIDADQSSQIVPDINHDHFLSHDPSPSINGIVGWGYSGGGLWAVPEMAGEIEENNNNNNNGENMKMKNNNGEEMVKMNMGQREASVLRYKEKRQNRLFSNKIRYQVRKLNAEKRPRLKGRFVKRS